MEWLSLETGAWVGVALIALIAWTRHKAARHRRATEARVRRLDRLRNLD
ncbi:MAG: hypothetical protein KJ587_07335 [Alphaproteobacteria bacterium]|nr:hypothetical protein [Alphaproteobacteria bacterium]